MEYNSPNKEYGYDVFISYSSKEKNVAEALCHYLEERKIRCWIAPRNILPGERYAGCIERAISKVRVFVIVYSKSAQGSTWVEKETNIAVSNNKIIIPFRIEDCPLQGAMKIYLNDVHWIDAVPHPDKVFGQLSNAISVLLNSSVTEPDFSSEPVPAGAESEQKQEQPQSIPRIPVGKKMFSKEDVIKIVNARLLFSLCAVLDILLFFSYTFLFRDKTYLVFLVSLNFVSMIYYCKLRNTEKSNVIFTTLVAISFIFAIPVLPVFFYEMYRSRKILQTCGLKTSFFLGVSKADLLRFEENAECDKMRIKSLIYSFITMSVSFLIFVLFFYFSTRK